MNVNLPNLGIDQEVKEYSIKKSYKDYEVETEVTGAVRYTEDDYKVLLQETVTGKSFEQAQMQFDCDGDTETIDCNILHNEGKINHKNCLFDKKLFIKSLTECLKENEINIFDYTASPINSLQGEKEEISGDEIKYYEFGRDKPDLNTVLAQFDYPLPDFLPVGGFYLTYAKVTARATSVEVNAGGGPSEEYRTHILTLEYVYTRLKSSTKHSDKWLPIPSSSDYYYSGFDVAEWGSPKYTTYFIRDGLSGSHWNAEWERGKANAYPEKTISNAITFNEVVEGLYSCTGKTLVSNFFDINADATQPTNEVYEFATEFLHQLRILQSYDIIRESAEQDSFGNSGIILARTLLASIKKFFNLIDVYDPDADVIRLEHLTYFMLKGVDLVDQSIAHGVEDEIEVNKDLVKSETWTMAAETPNGYTSVITYDLPVGKFTENTTQIEWLLTDVFGTINNEEYNQEEYKDLYYLVTTDGANIIGLNQDLLLNNIITKLHYYNRPSVQATHDSVPVQMRSFSIGLSAKVEFNGSIKQFNKIQPLNVVTTNIGTFLIQEIEFANDSIMKLTVSR